MGHLKQEVGSLLQLGVVVQIPQKFKGKRFYPHYYFFLKKKRGWRPILHLQHFNNFIHPFKMKMATLASIICSFDSMDWFTALNPQDTYFHISTSSTKKIPSIPGEVITLPVQDPTIHPVCPPEGIYQGSCHSSCSTKAARNPGISLSGQVVDMVLQ